MKKIIIIGCGFSGLSSAAALCKFRKYSEVTVIDKGLMFNFLPLLPDAIGRGISPDAMAFPIEELSKIYGFKFLNSQAQKVDLEQKTVFTDRVELPYDYLVISSGTETNFYGNNEVKKYAYKLDSADDARAIRLAIEKKDFENYFIAGGGYTGIELATNLRILLNKKSGNKNIFIIERAPSILGPLPVWMKEYVRSNLKKLNIRVLPNTAIEKCGESSVMLSGGETFGNAMVIWSAGVRAPGFIQELKAEKNAQGRIKVDEFLRLNENCFVTGDAAYFAYRNNFLRMAVQFAITEGECAGRNIINSIMGLSLRKYRPQDFGYIIPMANNYSCGRVFNINLKGVLPTMLHFIMCVYRSYGFKNKSGIIRGLIKGDRGHP